MKELEEGNQLLLDFKKIQSIAELQTEVIPAVVQDYDSKEVLILGYVNKLAFEKTLHSKKITFWSTSRNELWEKGATSGNYLELVEARVNCEQNSVLFFVRLQGQGACHTKDQAGNFRNSCYYRVINFDQTLKISDSF